jgi:dihydropyrimidinase
VIFDPDEERTISAKTHHMNVDFSCYEGMKVHGVTKTVLSRGELVIEEGKYVGRQGHGSFLKRGLAFSPK